ncbi:unnamed protein product, partial [Brenthis ino]
MCIIIPHLTVIYRHNRAPLKNIIVRVQDTIWPLWPSTMSKDINGQVIVTDGMLLRWGSLAGGGGPPAQPAPRPSHIVPRPRSRAITRAIRCWV